MAPTVRGEMGGRGLLRMVPEQVNPSGHRTITTPVGVPVHAEHARWTCDCWDCREFRRLHRWRLHRAKGAGGLPFPDIDEVVVLRLTRGIAVPTATRPERSAAIWFMLRAGRLVDVDIAARAGTTIRTVVRMSEKISRGYTCPLATSAWFVAA